MRAWPLVSSAGPDQTRRRGAHPLDESQSTAPRNPDPAGSSQPDEGATGASPAGGSTPLDAAPAPGVDAAAGATEPTQPAPTPPAAKPPPAARPPQDESATPPAAASPPPTAPPGGAGSTPPPPRPPAPPGGAGSTPPPPPPPLGFRDQIAATKDAAKRLVDAHVELGKAEFEEISGEIGRVAALAGIAVAAGLFAGLLLAIGLPLFLGELVFGSIGWGLLLGVETLVGVTIAAALMGAGVESTRIGMTALAGFAAGFAVALVLGSGVSNLIWGVIGENLLPLAAPDVQALAAAMVVLPIVLALLIGLLSLISAFRNRDASAANTPSSIGERIAVGAPVALYVGWLSAYAVAYSQGIAWFDWRLLGVIAAGAFVVEVVAIVIGHWRVGFGLLAGLSIGTGLGVILALFTAIAFGWRVGIAIGVAVGLGTWIAMLALEGTRIADLFSEENLKKRFYPERTVEMTKETIEWARARMPLSRKS